MLLVPCTGGNGLGCSRRVPVGGVRACDAPYYTEDPKNLLVFCLKGGSCTISFTQELIRKAEHRIRKIGICLLTMPPETQLRL